MHTRARVTAAAHRTSGRSWAPPACLYALLKSVWPCELVWGSLPAVGDGFKLNKEISCREPSHTSQVVSHNSVYSSHMSCLGFTANTTSHWVPK
jgi:hypothetical protein